MDVFDFDHELLLFRCDLFFQVIRQHLKAFSPLPIEFTSAI